MGGSEGTKFEEVFFLHPFFVVVTDGVCLLCTSTGVCLVVLTFDESYWQRFLFFVERTRLVR